MNNQFSLNIKTPCQENFNNFSPTPNGGFCNSCTKEVVDFTKMNTEELINYFSTKNKENTCGRFKSQQLNTYFPKPQQRKRLSILSGIGLACLSFFAFATAQAQKIEIKEKALEVNAEQVNKDIIVKGITHDEDGLPLPGVNVVLEDSIIGTQTNFDGYFEFPEKLKKGDVLIFSFVGYETKKITINDADSASKLDFKIDMSHCDLVFIGEVAVKEVYKSKRK